MFENFKVYETEFAGRPLVVETGKMAQLANGECLVRYGDTVVHVAATASAKPRTASTSSPFRWTLRRSCTRWARSPGRSSAGRAVPRRRPSSPAG